MIKKNYYDICGGDCDDCESFCTKSASAVPVLLRRKVYTKYIPPDMTALKLLAENENLSVDISSLSDEELQNLENQLTEELFGENYNNAENN